MKREIQIRNPKSEIRWKSEFRSVRAVQISRAEPEQANALTAIAFAAKRHWGYPEPWIESWRDVLTVRPEFVAGQETYAAVVDGRTIGFYALGRKGSRADLLHMWVLPEAMGRGVGRALFCTVLSASKHWIWRNWRLSPIRTRQDFTNGWERAASD